MIMAGRRLRKAGRFNQPPESRLTLSRTYNSATPLSGLLGFNWQHNFAARILPQIEALPLSSNQLPNASTLYSSMATACTSGWPQIAPAIGSTATVTGYSNGVCQLSDGTTMQVYSTDVSVAWTATPPGNTPQFTPLALQRPNGRIVPFVCSAGTCTPRSNVSIKLIPSASGFTVIDEQNRTENYTTTGVLTSVNYLGGYQQSLSYDSNGNLLTVVDSYGRQLTFANTNGQLTGVTTPDGNTIGYGYDTYNRLTTVTYQDGKIRTYQYTNTSYVGALTGIIDENGGATLYAKIGYDSKGRANSTIVGGVANSTSIVYNTNNTSSVTDPLGTTRTYSYQLIQGQPLISGISGAACDGCGAGNATTYDTAGYLQSSTDFNNQTTSYTFDDTRGLETQRIEGAGSTSQRTTKTTWDPNFRVPDQRSVINANGVAEALTNWVYNARGQATYRCQVDPAISGATSYTCGSVSNALAPTGVRQWSYTQCNTVGTCPVIGQLLTATDPRGNVTTYTYYTTTVLSGCTTLGGPCNTAGDVQTVTNALGQVTTYVSYDKNGRVTRIKDANGVYSDMTYHARGWLLTRTVRSNADGTPNSTFDATTTFAYDNVGNVTQVTQPDASYFHYVYDSAHRLTDIYDSYTPGNYLQGDHVHYTLDGVGNRTAEVTRNPSGQSLHALTRQYDSLNRLVETFNSTPLPVQTFTNPVKALPTYTDGYDGNGNAIYSIDGTPAQVGTEQLYDPLNRPVKTLQDHAGTGATRDTTTQYAYDTRDNLRSVIDPDNLTTNYTYDGLNNLTALSSPDTGNTGYTYDAAGNRLTQTDARGVTSTYSYDVLNRLTGISYPTTSLNITYAYDQPASGCYNVGRLTKITDNSGTTTYCYDQRGNVLSKVQVTNGTALTTSYSYTLADRLASITYPSGAIVSYTRDGVGRIDMVTYKANATATAVTLISNATYYPYGPLNVLSFGNGRSLTKTYDHDYAISQIVSSSSTGLIIGASVDVLGNLLNASSTIPSNPPTQQYLYDPLYRLTNVENGSGTSLESFTYDLNGDRLSKNGAAYTYSSPLTSHRLLVANGYSRTYDADGNVSSGPITFNGATISGVTFTFDNRNRLSQLSLSGASISSNYNGKGERVRKTLQGAGNSDTLYSYDEGGRLLSQYAASGSAFQADYIYLDSIPIAYATAGTVYYIETDQLGTPRQVIKPGATTASDTLVWKWDYFASNSAFGENAPSVQTITFNLRFPGQYFDTETGLNYNYFRDYESAIGRYLASDPEGLDGGINTYSYVSANPLDFVDRLGLWVKRCARKLGDKNKPATDLNDLTRHEYLNVSGEIFSFQRGSNLWWSHGRIDHDEDQNKGCTLVCGDPKFDQFVLDAIKLVGNPSYDVAAYPGTLMYYLGAMNCQVWDAMVLDIAQHNYLEKEKCPSCFK